MITTFLHCYVTAVLNKQKIYCDKSTLDINELINQQITKNVQINSENNLRSY